MSITSFALMLLVGAFILTWGALTLFAYGSSIAAIAVLILGFTTMWCLR